METDQVGEASHIGTGTSISIHELAELIQDITDTDSDIFHTEPQASDIEHSKADISKALKHLDFARLSLRERFERRRMVSLGSS